MSSVSTLPIELWLQILRTIYEVSLSSDIRLQDYPWVDTLRSKRCRASASAHRAAMVRSIGQVCRSWKMFAKQLRYQEVELGPFAFSFHELLKEHQLYSSIFNETRQLSVTTTWSSNTHDLSLLVQSMPRLEWLHLSTHEIEESYLRRWLPSILGPQPCLLYLDLKSLHHKETIFMDSESISLISGLAIRLRRLTCAIKYVAGSDGQAYHAPIFEYLQVLQLLDIRCDPGHEQAGCEWFSRWHLPSLKQFYIPRTWEYCTELLDRGVGAQLEVLDASVRDFFSTGSTFAGMTSPQAHSAIPERLWLLCPQTHIIISSRFTVPPEARPKLHYIFVYPFRRWTTGFDQIVLASLLTSLSSKWEEQGPENREYTFSLQYTELSWRSWAETSMPSIIFTSRLRSTLGGWKDFAKRHQMEVLDGYGVDIRDVAILSEGLDQLKQRT